MGDFQFHESHSVITIDFRIDIQKNQIHLSKSNLKCKYYVLLNITTLDIFLIPSAVTIAK